MDPHAERRPGPGPRVARPDQSGARGHRPEVLEGADVGRRPTRPEGLARARRLLTRYAIAPTMEVLSKAALILAQIPYRQMMDAQRYLAQQFFPREILDRADAWIRAHRRDGEAYLFGEQQLLLAMCLTLRGIGVWL